ncbi:unnamed protein product [Leptidea sinapis]|uniref:Uncharacterized protein n=1 Tax=Leptidea sinapis TaxID=189913 RepID=A0A5E4PW01_9NEOP|nr:unnamed protein product [Leptidea sinapis]
MACPGLSVHMATSCNVDSTPVYVTQYRYIHTDIARHRDFIYILWFYDLSPKETCDAGKAGKETCGADYSPKIGKFLRKKIYSEKSFSL